MSEPSPSGAVCGGGRAATDACMWSILLGEDVARRLARERRDGLPRPKHEWLYVGAATFQHTKDFLLGHWDSLGPRHQIVCTITRRAGGRLI